MTLSRSFTCAGCEREVTVFGRRANPHLKQRWCGLCRPAARRAARRARWAARKAVLGSLSAPVGAEAGLEAPVAASGRVSGAVLGGLVGGLVGAWWGSLVCAGAWCARASAANGPEGSFARRRRTRVHARPEGS